MSEHADIVTIGLVVVDIAVKPVSGLPEKGLVSWVDYIGMHCGGDALNEAVVASRLGARARVIAKTGDDPLSDFLIGRLQSEGVDTAGVVRSGDQRTATCVVLIDDQGERSFLYQPGANSALRLEDVDLALLDGAKCVSVASGIALHALEGEPLAELLRIAQGKGAMTFLDMTWDDHDDWDARVGGALPFVDCFVPSFDEAAKLAGETELLRIGRALCDMGVGRVAVKCGERGAFIYEGDGRGEKSYGGTLVPAFATNAVDATGAGDSFVGALMVRLAAGDDLETAARFACAVGGLVVQRVGASDGAPTPAEVESFVKESRT